jgi:ADP-ribose pyrophosphatase YjhB (NUDIX family)
MGNVAREETVLPVNPEEKFHTYSNPGLDPRYHSITTVSILA